MKHDDPNNAGNTSLDPKLPSDGNSQGPESSVKLTNDIPPPKRYAHHGKRRRRFTEELFRCQFVDKISRSDLVCNALLWRNRPEELRKHLEEHLALDLVSKLTDDQVRGCYINAKRIFLQGIPEDIDDAEEAEESDHDEKD